MLSSIRYVTTLVYLQWYSVQVIPGENLTKKTGDLARTCQDLLTLISVKYTLSL